MHMGTNESLEEDIQALNLADNILWEDFAEWSEYDDMQEVHSVHGDSRRER
jgi:hypothetical protein